MPNGLLFGGGGSAIKQLGLEVLGIAAVMSAVFLFSYVTVAAISAALGGILTSQSGDQVVAAIEAAIEIDVAG